MQILLEKFKNKTANVVIGGAGYVGLPFSCESALAGFNTVIYDISEEKVNSINSGRSYIGDVSDEVLSPLVSSGILKATTDSSIFKWADAIIICVPTPLNKTRDPDVSYIMSAAKALIPHLHQAQLVVLESTTYPSYTREILKPYLESTGCKVGENIFLSFSPERVDPSNKKYNTKNTPKVVGGITKICIELTIALYSHFIEKIIPVSSCDTAEMVKILENTFRAVNIGLANEMSIICKKLGIDVWEVIEAASTKPFGFMPFYPSAGLGGHCILPNEKIICRINGDVKVLSVADIFNSYEEDLVEVVGINESGDSKWDRVSQMFCRNYDGNVISVKTNRGYSVCVTELHPMLIVNNGLIENKFANELEIGDVVPTSDGSPENSNLWESFTVDFVKILPDWLAEKTKVRIKSIDGWWPYKEQVYMAADGHISRYDWIRNNSVPLNIYKKINLQIKGPISLVTGKGSSQVSISNLIKLTPNVARLIGYYLSEGCVTFDRSLRTRFSFNAGCHREIEDTKNILSSMGVKWSVYTQENTTHVKVSSDIFGVFIRDFLKCGVDCYSKQVPSCFLSAPDEYKLELIKGYLRGDGSVDWNSGKRKYTKNNKQYNNENNTFSVSFFSVSYELALGVCYLFRCLGFHPATYKRKDAEGFNCILYGTEAIDVGKKCLPDWHVELNKVLERKKIWTTPKKNVEVKSIISNKYNGKVYSIETEKTHTFSLANGIVVHNCIPIDPLYLSWKMRSLNYNAKFIELADSINSNMPKVVVHMAMEGLNKNGKALKDSKILIMGAAYKPNVNDVRESPALDIIEMLKKYGAIVEYEDPFIPEILICGEKMKSVGMDNLGKYDCTIIVTNHDCFDYEWICENSDVIVDTRNATKELREKFGSKIIAL